MAGWKHFVHQWVFKHGLPPDFITEERTHFTSHFLLEFRPIWTINKVFKTEYKHHTNCEVELLNHTTLSALRAFNADKPIDWELHSPTLRNKYNNQPQKYTPIIKPELLLYVSDGDQREPRATEEFPVSAQTKLRKTFTAGRWNHTLGDNLYICVEKNDSNEILQRLSYITEGTLLVINVHENSKTIVNEGTDHTSKTSSGSHVVLVPP